MQEQVPKNEEAPKPAITGPQGVTDPTATAIAKRLSEIQGKILDVTAKISDEELIKLRGIRDAAKARLTELAAEGKIPGSVKEATVSLVKNDGGIEVRPGAKQVEKPKVEEVDDIWANQHDVADGVRIAARERKYQESKNSQQ